MVSVNRYFVWYEGEGWRQTRGNIFSHLRAQNALSGFQRLFCVFLFFFRTVYGVVQGCVLQVIRDPGIGNRHKTEAGVFDSAFKRLRHNHLNTVGETGCTCCISHSFLLVVKYR